jgi:hypothetical protein
VPFNSPLLGHAEVYKIKLDKTGNYKYMCAPHPYMKGVVTVVPAPGNSMGLWIIILVILTVLLIIYVLYKINSIKKNMAAASGENSDTQQA